MPVNKMSRRERNLCSSCNNPPRPGKTQCQECADKARKRIKLKRKRGECLNSGCHNIPTDGKSRCELHSKMRSDHEKALREKRRALGICTSCGKNETHGTSMCNKCTEYFRNRRAGKKKRRAGGTTGTPIKI